MTYNEAKPHSTSYNKGCARNITTFAAFMLMTSGFYSSPCHSATVNQFDSDYFDLSGTPPANTVFPSAYPQEKIFVDDELNKHILDNKTASSLALEGYNKVKSGQKKQGIRDLLTASEMEPNELEISILLILAYIEDKNTSEAMNIAKKIQANQPDKPISYTMTGIVYGSKNELTKAKQLFEKALKLDPGNMAASWNLAIVLVSEGQIEAARNLYHSVLENNPGHLGTLIQLAKLEFEAGNIDKSISLMEDAVKIHEKNPQPSIVLGKLFIAEGKLTQAQALLEPAIIKFPENPDILSLTGFVYLKNNAFSKAVQVLESAIKISPNDTASRYNLVIAYAKLNKTKLAIDKIDSFIKQNPEHIPFQFLMAELLAQDGQPQASQKILLQLDQSIPDSSLIKELLGKIALAENRNNDAIHYFQEALNLRKDNSLVLQLASAQIKNGNKDAAFLTLRSWIKENKSDYLIINILADHLLLNGDFDEAEQLYREVAHIKPETAFAQNNLAWLLLQKGAINEAYIHSQIALELLPNDAKILDIHGLILLEKGEIDKAYNNIKIAAKKEPNNFNIQFHLARIYAQRGQSEKSKAILKQILQNNSKFAESENAQKLLAKLEAKN